MHWCQGKRGRDAWDPRKLKGGSPAQPSPAALAGGEGCWGCVQRQPNVYAHVRGALLAVLAGTGYGSLFLGHELKRGEEAGGADCVVFAIFRTSGPDLAPCFLLCAGTASGWNRAMEHQTR
jgi:hypothetical protein